MRPEAHPARTKQDRTARADALLNGTPVPAAPGPAAAGTVHYVDDEPRWKVPATRPECGARVDQSTASMAEHPTCRYCAQPLPCEPAVTEDD